ncbi:MAG TPA: YtxH domain-containing protein [Bryobacteraceae bacterium]|nr:YtxH domain-containing protein [Bryobacteraceae bacterium]
MADQDEGGKLGWFLAGAILGGAVALLYAPKSGRETREFINKKTDEGREALSETGQQVYEKGREIYDKGKQIADEAAELFERGRRLVRG